jgi:hypothetical protein
MPLIAPLAQLLSDKRSPPVACYFLYQKSLKEYAAYRMSFIRLNKQPQIIYISCERLETNQLVFAQSCMVQLKKLLPEFTFKTCSTMVDSTAFNDWYQSGLTLLLKLSKEVPSCRQEYYQFIARNRLNYRLFPSLLSEIAYVSSPCLLMDNAFQIFTMPIFKMRINKEYWHLLLNILMLVYMLSNEENQRRLVFMPILWISLIWETVYMDVNKTVLRSIIGNMFKPILICALYSFMTLYINLPRSPIQQQIFMPYYVLTAMGDIVNGLCLQAIKLPLAACMVILLNHIMPFLNNIDYADGHRAIMSTALFMMAQILPGTLWRPHANSFLLYLQTQLLSGIYRGLDSDEKMFINTGTLHRVLHIVLENQITISYQVIASLIQSHCELDITPVGDCYNFTINCQSRFFQSPLNDTLALTQLYNSTGQRNTQQGSVCVYTQRQ